MTDLLITLAPILLVDVLNPVLLAALIYAATRRQPVVNSSAMLLGHTLMYFSAGFLMSFGVDAVADRLSNPNRVDYTIGALIGAYCVYWALKPAKPASDPDLPEWQLTPVKSFGIGVVINSIGLPFAFPYLAAIDQILQTDLSTFDSLRALGIYNAGYALPFMSVPLIVLLAGRHSESLLQKLDGAMIWAADKLMPWLVFALGVWLLVEAGVFFLQSPA